MNVPTIEMSAYAARQAFNEYRGLVAERRTPEDAALLAGYRALMRGRRILNIVEVFKAAGVDNENRPRIAIARADTQRVYYRAKHSEESLFSRFASWNGQRGKGPGEVVIPFVHANTTRERQYQALVPLVPPRLRPKADLSKFHILWEAEWVAAPVDPILLRRIHRHLFVVLATWDLTPLEQSIVAGRV